VSDQLVAMGFEVFLPKVTAWSRRDGHRHLTLLLMFPGYLFLYNAMDKASYIKVCQVQGLVSILGDSVGSTRGGS